MRELTELIAELPAELRQRALIHHTWVEDPADSYRRLAFIGDSVLSLTVVTALDERLPGLDSGDLTQIRGQVVSGVSCAVVGRELGVPEMLDALEIEPSRESAVPKEVLRDAERPVPEMTEALIGACYLTFGFERTSSAVVAAFAQQIDAAIKSPIGPKSLLQTLIARRRARLRYDVFATDGSGHPTFKAVAMADSEKLGEGEGRSKKAAEWAAAVEALERLDAPPDA